MTWMVRSRSGRMILAGTLAWASATGMGFLAIDAYEVMPGPSNQPVEYWRGGSPIALARDRHTRVMAAHPRCLCTRASAAQLARVLARCKGGNRGQEAVLALIGGGSLGSTDNPAFGCPIFEPSRPPTTRDAACTN